MNKIFLILGFTLFFAASAQNANYEKSLKLFNESKLKAANKLIDKCLLNSETKDNPNVLLLKSKIMFAISKDAALFEKFPSAAKDAMKYAEKSITANKNENAASAFKTANIDYFTTLIRFNNKEALEAYNTKKYAKALPLFKRSIFFGLDTQSLVLAADCYWNMDQRPESLPLFKQAAEMIYAAVLDGNSKVYGYHKEPFRKLCLYYIEYQAFDSAYVIVKNGREILPNDPVLNEYTYRLMRFTLDKIPPSEDYLLMVRNSLKDFPADSFLNHRENSIYIYLLNGLAQANDQVQFDSLFKKYAAGKASKSGLKQINEIKRFDIFAGEDLKTFVQHIKYYFAEIGLSDACYSTWVFESTNPELAPGPEQVKAFMDKLSDRKLSEMDKAEYFFASNLLNEKNVRVAEFIFEKHLKLYPKSNPFKKTRADYLANKNNTAAGYRELLPLINMNDAAAFDFPKQIEFKTAAKTYRLRLIDESADSGDFRLGRNVYSEAKKRYPDQNKALEILWRKLVISDFKQNYYGSRVNPKGRNEAGVPEYVWNGVADSCIAGEMPMDVILRAEQRINYFRRMAGVSEEIVLSRQDNEYCMYAALMCEANKSMSHSPSDGWRCYIPAGLDALKNSILSRDGNPAIAITAAMGQNHPTAGNRRWLLYPKAEYMGIGSSKTYSAIKALDYSRDIDSNKYKNQFVAWPPANECPKMLLFKKWSFSIDRNLEGAVVSMKDEKGNEVPLKQEAVVNGYGMNTLVWEPEITPARLGEQTVYFVSVKLKDGTVYNYKVIVIEIPVK